jgi:hypothetical protein
LDEASLKRGTRNEAAVEVFLHTKAEILCFANSIGIANVEMCHVKVAGAFLSLSLFVTNDFFERRISPISSAGICLSIVLGGK